MKIADYPEGDNYYISTRLTGSLVREKDTKKFLVVDSIHNGFLLCSELPGYDLKEYPFENIDINPPPVGYVNKNSEACYCWKYPYRQWKQGLDTSSLRLESGYLDFNAHYFLTMLRGVYPNVESSVEKLYNKEAESVGLSRDIAIRGLEKTSRGFESRLDYKGLKGMGYLVYQPDTDLKTVEVDLYYSYMQEAIEESFKEVS